MPVIFKRAAFPRASDDSIRPSQQPLRQQRWDRRQHALQRPRRAVLQRRFSVDLATFAFVKNCYCADSLFSEAGAGVRPESLCESRLPTRKYLSLPREPFAPHPTTVWRCNTSSFNFDAELCSGLTKCLSALPSPRRRLSLLTLILSAT